MAAATSHSSNNSDATLALQPDTLRHVFGSEFTDAFLVEQRRGQDATSEAVAHGAASVKKDQPASASNNINRATAHSHSHSSKVDKNPTEPQPQQFSPASLLAHHMEQKLEALIASNPAIANHAHAEGRLGPEVVKFDHTSHLGSFIVSNDRLGLSSQSNFASMRANVCVFKGKWQYEIQIGSNGIMQIGWVTLNTKFTSEKGVGDSTDSYGFDGHRLRKWNSNASPYGGQMWKNGDILGCCIDLDNGVIEYFRNGTSLGQAFKGVQHGPGNAYFPAVSLTYSESLVANFGAAPFLFPVAHFEPLQLSKLEEDTRLFLLLNWLEKVVDIYPSNGGPSHSSNVDAKSTIVVANQLFKLLEENIRSAYVIEHTLLPFLAKHAGLPLDIKSYDASTFHSRPTGKLGTILDLMWVYLEEIVMHNTLERLSIILMNYVKSHTYSFAYPYQMYSIQVLTGLVEHRETRRFFLHHLLFDKTKLTNFLYVRPLDEDTMKTVIPVAWWPGKSPDTSVEAKAYERGCNTIHAKINQLENLQVNLLKVLMTNTDGKETRPSSRSIFLRQLRNYIADTLRHGPGSMHPINKPMCTFFRLLKTASALWQSEIAQSNSSATPVVPDIPPAMFYDISVDYYDLDRVGGNPNHLYKTYHVEVSEALGTADYYTPPDPNAPRQHGYHQVFFGPHGPFSSLLSNSDDASEGNEPTAHQDTPFPSVLGLIQTGGPGADMGARSAPAIMTPGHAQNRNNAAHAVSTGTGPAATAPPLPLSEIPSLVDISVTPATTPASVTATDQENDANNQQHEMATQIGQHVVHLLPDLTRAQTTPLAAVGSPLVSPLLSPLVPNQEQENESNAESMSISDTSSASLGSAENAQAAAANMRPQIAFGLGGGQNIIIPLPGLQHMFGPDMAFTLFPGSLFGFGGMGRQIRPKNPHEMEISRHRGAMDIRTSLRELLDDTIMVFIAVVSSHVEKVVGLRTNIDSYIEAIANARQTLTKDAAKLTDAQKTEMNRSIEIFNEKLGEEMKHMTWIKSALFTADRQSLIVALLKSVLTALKKSSALGLLFRFTPDAYVSALVKLTTLLTNHLHPTVPYQQIQEFPVLCRDIAEFTALHFTDSRIVLSETKDTLTQALSKFICDRTMLTAIETMPGQSQSEMVKALLKPYENRAWAQSNWMLVRIWQGNGFGFQYLNCTEARKSYRMKGVQDEFGISTDLPPTPSPILQGHIKTILMSDQKAAASYVHSLLNQLNWSFSEFIGLIQEINTASSQSENVYFDHRQLKVCCTCFELTQALLRVVEMISSIATPVLTDFSKESAHNLLERLCMLLSQVLNRVASRSGTFGQVLDLELAGLDAVTYYAMLTSVAGILVALLRNEVKITDKSKLPVTKTILLEPSMQVSSLDFLIGESRVGQQQERPFTLRNYVPQDISPKEIYDLQVTIAHLKKWSTEFQQESETISDDDICTICYAYSKSATFLPCNHRTCQSCITHHLMNKHQCFFCKRKIEKVVADDGSIVYENTPDTEADNEDPPNHHHN